LTDTSAPTPSTGSETAPESGPGGRRRGTGLSAMLLPELKQMAGGLGVKGVGSMRKSQLVDAIKAAQSGGQSSNQSGGRSSNQSGGQSSNQSSNQSGNQSGGQSSKPAGNQTRHAAEDDGQGGGDRPSEERNGGARADDSTSRGPSEQTGASQGANRPQRQQRARGQRRDDSRDDRRDDSRSDSRPQGRDGDQRDRDGDQSDRDGDQRDRADTRGREDGRDRDDHNQNNRTDDGSRRNRRRRGRDRNDRTRGGREPDTQVLEDDVLVPAAGILDVLDNYAFVRTSGYLAGPDDVYVSLSMVRRYGLRPGDAVTGQVRQPREGDRKEKFNPLVRIDTINGADPETARNRVEFSKLTPLYASERLRLETDAANLIGRVIDIAAPIGKGQRGLIVSPSKAGKTMIMQSIANSITTNNPECHLMVVLVDERPEEVTDFERSVKGEVISSTFDRPPSDHTAVAELAIERAKRLVELGHDVVVLLDGITRLGRAYNLAAPASGRILSGGVDSAALYPPKKFFGAARNIEDGGSLTILATALIESGSKMDEVIFEEFKGTGNMEIRLRRDFADKRIFPAIDAVQSGTRREELLMSREELAIVWKLRRVLSGLDGQQALELLLERLKKSSTNIEFLMQVQKSTPSPSGTE
jgi:transcription termination factor Rho